MKLTDRYGTNWRTSNDIEIEKGAIIRGGRWKEGRNECGEGLFFHYKALWRLWWPDDDEHRWADLILRNYLENQYTTLMGSANSSKTYTIAKIGLTDYACFPDNTLTLVSSTDVRGLELRVWGSIKSLWERAKEMDDDFPGYVVDYLHAISSQEAGDGKIRDLRRGLICIPCLSDRGQYKGLGRYCGAKAERVRLFADECFPAGTLVDTPTGPCAIESLSPGDYVLNCLGKSRVVGVLQKQSNQLVRIHFSNRQRFIDCTPNHEFLTNMGWVKAFDITSQHEILTTDEAMRLMRKGCFPAKKELLLRKMPMARTSTPATVRHLREGASVAVSGTDAILLRRMPHEGASEALPVLRKAIFSGASRRADNFLFEELWSKMEVDPARNCETHAGKSRQGGWWAKNQRNDNGGFRREETPIKLDAKIESQFDKKTRQERRSAIRRSWIVAHSKPPRDDTAQPFSGCRSEFSSAYWQQFQIRQEAKRILDRSGVDRNSTRRGGRREISQQPGSEGEGSGTNGFFERARVDRVEILKPDGDARYDRSQKSYRVYNLQVEGHHSYSVRGLVAQNCQFMQQSFLGAIANLRNNPDFKAAFMGNPLGMGDPLDQVAEPECGWSNHPIPDKTTVWKTRKFRGVCVNLIGTDSPNFDFPGEVRFPYLTRPDVIQDTLRDYGPNSSEYWSQCAGARVTGLIARKVITRELCEQHHALEPAEWLSSRRTKVYAVDAAYGSIGGDRCVGGWVEFGQTPQGVTLLSIHRPSIIPIQISIGVPPEDQIAQYVRDDCIAQDIPPENVFHDATGRGSLGTSFARLWSPRVNPVEFGGSATARPVRHDVFIRDPRTGLKRLMLCHEKYANFVTELWYSVRYTIESDQLRDLPNDVMEEGCLREWKEVRSSKVQVEPKKDMKERVGRSPDLFDWCATALEGARRLGFEISRIPAPFDEFENFLAKEEKKTQILLESKMLKHW